MLQVNTMLQLVRTITANPTCDGLDDDVAAQQIIISSRWTNGKLLWRTLTKCGGKNF